MLYVDVLYVDVLYVDVLYVDVLYVDVLYVDVLYASHVIATCDVFVNASVSNIWYFLQLVGFKIILILFT